MPGMTKRKYQGELIRFQKSINRPLGMVAEILKPGYTIDDLREGFKKYYPYEWQIICERYKQYSQKDNFLVSVGKKRRYKPMKPNKFFEELPKVKYLMSVGYRKKHAEIYNEVVRQEKEKNLEKKRLNKIQVRNEKINLKKQNMQIVEPLFLEALISAYHKKGNTIEDKLEIFKEIQKFDCDRATQFFYKLNDSERNNQIRNMAFQHLQNTGHYVKLRKNFKGKKKIYMTENSNFYVTPADLAKRLELKTSVQNKKRYDVFLSHSSKDAEQIRNIMHILNKEGLVCYCDWTSDNDFLKRSMVSDYTKEVLKKRMLQSENLIYICSKNSRQSKWVRFELDYYKNYGKGKIYVINLDDQDLKKNAENYKELSYNQSNRSITVECLKKDK